MTVAGTANAHHPRLGALPYLVLAATLALTAAVTLYVYRSIRHGEEVRFRAGVREAEAKVRWRLETYVDALRATASYCEGTSDPTAEGFAAFVRGLKMQENYPGIQGIGYSVRVEPDKEAALVEQMREQGRPDFHVWTTGPAAATREAEERHAVVFLEPGDARNNAAIGYDMYSDPVRRPAMRRARDTGEPAASGKVRLVQETHDDDVQAGFLIYVPVYRDGELPAPEKRQDLVQGFVYAPFRAGDLLTGIFENGIEPWLDVAVYDQSAGSEANLMFHRAGAGPDAPGHVAVEQLDVAGRPWELRFATRAAFQPLFNRVLPPIIAIAGVLFSIAVFLATLAEAHARAAAERIADDLRRSREALQVSEAMFRRLFDSNLIGVVLCDLTGRVFDGNEAFFRLIGRSREEVAAGAVRFDQMTPDEYADADQRAGEQVKARGACDPYEKEFVRADGTRVPVMVGTALLEGPGERCVAFNVDLTTLKRAQADLQRAMESAEEARRHAETANRLKDEFLATLSHELRTPLNAILGWAQILVEDSSDPDDVREGIVTIERNARVQAQLIEDLLDISRIVSGKLRLDVRNVDPTTVIDAAISSVQLAADAKGVRLVRVKDPAIQCLVWGDANRLQQVVWNLLTNAIKFTPKGGTVEVTQECDESHVHIAVRDTGKGIPQEFLPYVFDRFRQADATTTRKFGGLGLGLSIVRHLVELHGGTIVADSPGEGKGATFRLSLPVKTTPVPLGYGAREQGSDYVMAAHEPDSLHGVRVLVVEDEPDALDLVVRMLKARDAEAVGVPSGEQALAEMAVKRFDVIVSDIAMPDMDGYEFLRWVRALADDEGGNTPAIALTAFARPEDRKRTAAAGYQAHVAKPVNPVTLCAAVGQLARAGV